MTQYVALLRGINVGGSNIIRMTDLKRCFEEMGFSDVTTYIQSGNVLFRTHMKDAKRLSSHIEKGLSDAFHYQAKAVVVSCKTLQAIVKGAPPGFGKEPSRFRYDVIFLKNPLSAKAAMRNVTIKEGVDQAFQGRSVLYFSRLIVKASQSHLTRIISLPVYKHMTIRNWNTTTKLLALTDAKE